MKHALIATTILVCAAVAAAAPGNASPAAAGACYSKNATINGKSVIVACGPASATLQYKGKTYVFKPGTCFRSGPGVIIDLGTSMVSDAKDNGGFAHANITLLSNQVHTVEVQADHGTLSLNGSATYSKMAVTGTFKGTNSSFGGVGAGKPVPFSGSWNCGAAIYKF
jgi:hypothetical protein